MFSLYRFLHLIFQPIFITLGLPPHSCRFTPSCSHYCEQAIHKFGLIKGLKLSVHRLARCRPGTPAGLDPVPNAEER